MTQRETNSWNMISGVKMYMENGKSAWDKEPMITETMDKVIEQYDMVNVELTQLRQQQTTGITDEQYGGLNKAIALVDVLAKRIALFARRTNDLVLRSEVDFSKSELDDGTYDEIIKRLTNIASRGQEKLAELAAYKVKQEQIDEAKAAIKEIQDKPAERKSTTGNRMESNTAVSSGIKEILRILREELDEEVDSLVEDREFVTGYFKVRRTDDIGGRGAAAAPPPAE